MFVIYAILAFILILLETTFLDFPATLLFVSFLSLLVSDFRKIFLIAFLTGFFYDLMAVGLLGQTSFLFLAISLVAFLYRKKFVHTHLVFEILFFSFSYKLWQFFKNQNFSLLKWLLIVFLGILAIFWTKKLGFAGNKKDRILME